MIYSGVVSSNDELEQIHKMNQQNLKQNISAEQIEKEGFVSWLYSVELLKKMHSLAPSIIAKEGSAVIGYALTTLREAGKFHADLFTMIENLGEVKFQNKALMSHSFYFMGQVCIAKAYRGKGVFDLLYEQHKKVYKNQFDFILTEVSTANYRSLKAHKRIGFETVHTYKDSMDEWQVIVWNWK